MRAILEQGTRDKWELVQRQRSLSTKPSFAKNPNIKMFSLTCTRVLSSKVHRVKMKNIEVDACERTARQARDNL